MIFRSVTGLTACVLVCGLAATADAADGVLLAQKIGLGAGAQTTQTQIEKTRMRTEVTGANGSKQIVIFDGAKQVLDILDVDAKTYTELTKADLDKLSAQLQGAMSMMAAQMANLPPAQRAQMEAMMQGRGMPAMPAAASKPDYRKGGTSKVARWTCDVYEAYENGQKTGEVCTVDAAALGFGAADFEVTNQLKTFISSIMPGAAGQVSSFGSAETQGYTGFPVKSTMTVSGQQITTEVTEATRQNFADSVFAVPAGFTKKDLLGGMMGGAGRGRQ